MQIRQFDSFDHTGTGDSIVVEEVVKDGVKLEMKFPPGVRFEAGARARGEIPTAGKPLVVRVWISKGKARVLDWSYSFDIPPSVSIYADVIGGKISTQYMASADFKIHVDLQPADLLHPRKLPAAGVERVSVWALDGGLVETDDLFLYEAPLNGYTNRVIRTDWKTFSPGSVYRWDVPFYFQVRGKYYGSMRVMLTGISLTDNNSLIGFDLATRFALDGGRILEADTSAAEDPVHINREELSRKNLRPHPQL